MSEVLWNFSILMCECFRILSLKTKDTSASSWLFDFVSYFLARYKNKKVIWGFSVIINTSVILQGTRQCRQVGDYECVRKKNSIEEMENKFHWNIRKRLWTWGLPRPTTLQPSDPSWKEHRLSWRKQESSAFTFRLKQPNTKDDGTIPFETSGNKKKTQR